MWGAWEGTTRHLLLSRGRASSLYPSSREDAQYGDYLYLRQERKLVPLESATVLEGALTEEEQRWADGYKAWCRSAHGFEGDCLGGALVGGKYLDLRGRYMWAMAMSKSPVLEEFEKALGEMVSMQAVMQAAMCTIVVLLVLLTMPEPVTKFIAAWATTALVLWVGAKTLYNLVTGWFQLMTEVKAATTVEGVREAGEKFGRLFSREAAQAFAASSSAPWCARTSDSSSSAPWRASDSSNSGRWCAPGDAQQPHSARRHAPANLREALIRAQERRKVRGVVEIQRRIREPNDPPARCSAPRPREQVCIAGRVREPDGLRGGCRPVVQPPKVMGNRWRANVLREVERWEPPGRDMRLIHRVANLFRHLRRHCVRQHAPPERACAFRHAFQHIRRRFNADRI